MRMGIIGSGNVGSALGTCGQRPGIRRLSSRKDTGRLHNSLTPDFSSLAVGHNTSAGEEVAKRAVGARVVKAFNTSFADLTESKSRSFGSVKATAGPPSCARCLEPVAMLMMQLRFNQKMWSDLALGLLGR